MSATLKDRITEDMKAAMRAKDSVRLGTIRLIQAAIKQREVDERITLDDDQVTAVLTTMLKQRKDSISQFESAGRQDLADKEKAEVEIINAYMPEQLSEEEVDGIIKEVIAETGAQGPKDMGKVMGSIKPRLQGRADMGQVSQKIKALLA